jgi:phosphopantetheine adenylyltransferase
MSKKYAMFIGRWQTWHKGHEWLINQQLKKGKDCWVAIRNVPTDENNLKTAQEVMMELSDEPFFKENSHKIQISIIPDIESVNYGRAVGYDVIYHEPPKEIEQISGTAIRKKYIDSNGDVIVYNIEKEDDSTTEETHS